MWAKIDDAYFTNDKVLAVSGRARYLHLAAIIWAAGHSPAGIVPKSLLPALGALAGHSN